MWLLGAISTPAEFLCQNGANGIANIEHLDQTAPLGAVWSGSALFAKSYLSKNLGSFRLQQN